MLRHGQSIDVCSKSDNLYAFSHLGPRPLNIYDEPSPSALFNLRIGQPKRSQYFNKLVLGSKLCKRDLGMLMEILSDLEILLHVNAVSLHNCLV
jgi:hypothetical protein